MATIVPPQTWRTGYMLPSKEAAPWQTKDHCTAENGDESHYVIPSFEERLSSSVHNSLGSNTVRTWPTLYNGTESPQSLPAWWQPPDEVDVLISGAGPFGLEVAISLARQGVTFRIIGIFALNEVLVDKSIATNRAPDKAEGALLAGRADAIQPRSLEYLHSWGLVEEVTNEGPMMDHSVMYKDGEKLLYTRTAVSDSKYRGVPIISQGQLERIYIRDLMRHRILVERHTCIDDFNVDSDPSESHPVQIRIKHEKTGGEKLIKAKFLVGAEGAASKVRKQLGIPFDGTTTDVHWGIMDCKFETDFPYITTFSIVMSTEHGGCVVVPREDGYTRIYTKLSAQRVKELAYDRREAGGRVDVHSITAEEVLAQTNKVFSPFKVSFASPLSWFAVWKISERVVRSFSSPDLRVHLGGDAAHVHSVLGAMGLNSSIYDASNLGWKLGLCARNLATPSALLPSYDLERRLAANRVIRASGAYLRFMCGLTDLPLADLRGTGDNLESYMDDLPKLDGTREGDLRWCGAFFGSNASFLIGLEMPQSISTICPAVEETRLKRPITVENGRRAPNPRVCFDDGLTGYLYDKMTGAARFHILVFGSDLQGPVRQRIAHFSQRAMGPNGFFQRFGGATLFNIVLVLKAAPFDNERLLEGADMKPLRQHATMVYDDRSPDEDAAYWYGINHAQGAVVAVRPDLWVGTSCWPEETEALETYLKGFLVDKSTETANPTGHQEVMKGVNCSSSVNGVNGIQAHEGPLGVMT